MKNKLLNTDLFVSLSYDLIIIGGGQSALACAFYLRRTNLKYLILDKQEEAGGAWRGTWDSLSLFSTSDYSSLPGWMMQETKDLFPNKSETIDYLKRYEERYQFPIIRPVEVLTISKHSEVFTVVTSRGTFKSIAIISATGTWSNPFIPELKGIDLFCGRQIHSAFYRNPNSFKDQKVLIVGGGNSGAQILSELSLTNSTAWSTLKQPTFMPFNIDGRVLFNLATEKYNAIKAGKPFDDSKINLEQIVRVPTVVAAQKRNVLLSKGPIVELTKNGVIWESGEFEDFDAIVWCTGFKYATQHLDQLGITDKKGWIETIETRAKQVAGLWLVGYGEWTGFASATLIGVGRSARETIKEVVEYFENKS